MKSIFSIITTINTIEYEFKNGVVLEIPKKLVIMTMNLLICYLIVKIDYAKLLLITKLIFIGIEFEVFGEASCTYDGLAKLQRETGPS